MLNGALEQTKHPGRTSAGFLYFYFSFSFLRFTIKPIRPSPANSMAYSLASGTAETAASPVIASWRGRRVFDPHCCAETRGVS